MPTDVSTRNRPRSVRADWDDVEAAAWAAAPRAEMTIVSIERPSTTTQVIELVSARDEVAWLTARREPPPPATPADSDLARGENVEIQLTFTLGRFGDPEREWAFLVDLVDRLQDLRGVRAAPIRWDAR